VTGTINTTKVTGRRQLHFDSLEDILADVERLAQSKDIRALGNLSPGQIFKHLAIVMNKSIDGFVHRPPTVVRFLIRLLFKRKVLTQTMSAGFKLPAKAEGELIPPATSLEEGLQSIRHAIKRLKTEATRAPSAAFGPLSTDEWNQLHCHHAELHLSFLIPVN
jgi:Protein of unknown function (DUF1569)